MDEARFGALQCIGHRTEFVGFNKNHCAAENSPFPARRRFIKWTLGGWNL